MLCRDPARLAAGALLRSPGCDARSRLIGARRRDPGRRSSGGEKPPAKAERRLLVGATSKNAMLQAGGVKQISPNCGSETGRCLAPKPPRAGDSPCLPQSRLSRDEPRRATRPVHGGGRRARAEAARRRPIRGAARAATLFARYYGMNGCAPRAKKNSPPGRSPGTSRNACKIAVFKGPRPSATPVRGRLGKRFEA